MNVKGKRNREQVGDIQYRGICAGRSSVKENRQRSRFYTHIRDRGGYVLFGQRQTEHRPGSDIQNGADTAFVRNTVAEKNSEEIKMNVAYRWFLGYLMNEEIPHFSTISYNFKHRYTEKTIEEIFYWILDEINNAGYLSPEVVFVDGTHIKANANLKKAVKKAVPQAAKIYEKQ